MLVLLPDPCPGHSCPWQVLMCTGISGNGWEQDYQKVHHIRICLERNFDWEGGGGEHNTMQTAGLSNWLLCINPAYKLPTSIPM